MGVPSAVRAGDGSFDTARDALRMASAAMDYLNSPCAASLDGAACGELLVGLGEVQAKLTAAHARVLRRFDTADAHDADGYGSSSAWLTAKAGMSKQAARSAVRQMRQLGERPLLGDALAAGDITDSLALTIAGWTGKLPAEMRTETDRILLQAATAGAGLDDLAVIAACAIEKWRQQRPDPDGPDDGFDDRRVQLGSTFGGAAVVRGNLTPECAAAVRAVIEALGKKAGPADDRDQGKRFHDALQLACTLLLRARLVPQRSGADTQAVVHIPLSQLRGLPGAPELEDAWLRARAGEDGYLLGPGAVAATCDAQTVPVVTATLNPDVIDKMIALARAAAETAPPGRPSAAPPAPAGDSGVSGSPGTPGNPGSAGRPGTTGTATAAAAAATATASASASDPSAGGRTDEHASGRALSPGPSPAGRLALRYAMARLAVDLVSGPDGVAAALRRGLLEKPWNTPSLPLDIGYSDSIPGHIRRAVLLRDRACAWPRCGRPAVHCDVHHLRHKQDGGETSVANCALVCQFHHDVCIHRRGWQLILHPDGTTQARSPDGRHVLHSHGPPGTGTGG